LAVLGLLVPAPYYYARPYAAEEGTGYRRTHEVERPAEGVRGTPPVERRTTVEEQERLEPFED
jgi:hypothetical protein